jgi:hypothetical protein
MDPELAAVLAPLMTAAADAPLIARGDWRGLRESANTNLALVASLGSPVANNVKTREMSITMDDGAEIPARWYSRGDERPARQWSTPTAARRSPGPSMSRAEPRCHHP